MTKNETSTIEVTEVKPKRGRKKKVIEVPDAVMAEIETKVVSEPAISSEVAEIIKPKNTKKVSALRRITDDGEINLAKITPEEMSEYTQIGSKLNVHDKMSIRNYGSELSEQLNRSTKELMSLGRTSKLGDETTEIMQDISRKLAVIDLDDIKKPNWFVRTVRQIPILNKIFCSVEKFIEKYDTMEQQVTKMQDKLHAAQAIALRDNTELEKRFQDTLSYIGVLEKLIIAAKIKAEQYGKAIEVMEADPSKYSPIDIHDTKVFKHELDKRISSMLTWHLSFNQSLFRIRDIQDANIAHSNSISETVDNMMPQLRDQLQQAVVLYNLEQGLKAHEAMIDGFNEILKHNADAAHDMKVRVTERTERTGIDIETLKYNQQKLIETNRDTMRIMAEAQKKRLENEREMAKMESELDTMLSGIEPGERVSAEAIESKYND